MREAGLRKISTEETIGHVVDFVRSVAQVERLLAPSEAGQESPPDHHKSLRQTRRAELRALKSCIVPLRRCTSDTQRHAVELAYQAERPSTLNGDAEPLTDKDIMDIRDRLMSCLEEGFLGDDTALEACTWAVLIPDFLARRRLNGPLFR